MHFDQIFIRGVNFFIACFAACLARIPKTPSIAPIINDSLYRQALDPVIRTHRYPDCNNEPLNDDGVYIIKQTYKRK